MTPVITNVPILLSIVLLGGCLMVSTASEKPPTTVTGRVLSKSDVQTREDRPVNVLVAVLSRAKLDSLLGKREASTDTTGAIFNPGQTIQADFEASVSGYDVSGPDGRFLMEVTEPGTHFLCVTGETEVPMEDSWFLAGCMNIEIPEKGAVDQDLYMQFGSLVSSG